MTLYSNNERIRALVKEYQRQDIPRSEKKEILEKIKLEEYKQDSRKPVTFRAQAVINLIFSLLSMVIMVVGIITKYLHLTDVMDVFVVAVLVCIGIFCIVMSRFKKEPADELAKELMTKATAYSVNGVLAAAILTGIFMHLNGNRCDIETYSITGEHVIWFGYVLALIHWIMKNAIYLWLDRTPASDEEE